MKEELNMIEAEILRIFRSKHKKSDQGLDVQGLLTETIKDLSKNFESIIHSLAEKGYIIHNGTSIILTDKGDQFLYDTKLYTDY